MRPVATVDQLIQWCEFVNGEPGVIDEDISRYNPRLGEWEPQRLFRNSNQNDMVYLPRMSVLEEDRLEECYYESISNA
ncbi:hypothetical protein KA005_12685 [bacterium]|nr:hypothetical protein [bacterium]